MAGRVQGKGIAVTGAAGRSATRYLPGQAKSDFASGILKGRPAQAEDLVGTRLFLSSSDSDYLTGQVIMADGGMVLV